MHAMRVNEGSGVEGEATCACHKCHRWGVVEQLLLEMTGILCPMLSVRVDRRYFDSLKSEISEIVSEVPVKETRHCVLLRLWPCRESGCYGGE